MKTILKATSLSLALLMLSTALFGCKNKENEKEKETVSTSVSQANGYAEQLEERDFGGKEFVIYDANNHPDMHVNFSLEFTEDGVLDALWEKDEYIKARNNVVLTYRSMNASEKDVTAAMRILFQSGDKPCDIMVGTVNGGSLATLASEGVFTNLMDLPTVEFNQKWWSAYMNEQLSLGGKMFFTTGDIMASVYQAPAVVYGNKKLLEENQIATSDILYQKVRDGEWTLDYMYELSKGLDRDTNEDGVYHANDDFFGALSQANAMSATQLLVGCGVDMSYIQGDMIVVNDDIEQIEGVTSTLQKMFKKVEYDTHHNDLINITFKQDRAVFLTHLVEAATLGLRDMVTDFVILPMPKADVEQAGYRSAVNGWVHCFVAVPKFDTSDTQYAEDIGYLLEMMARSSYDIVRPMAFDNVVMLRSVKDPESAEMLEIVFNSLYLDYQSVYDFGGATSAIAKHVYEQTPLSSALAGVESKMRKEAGELASAWLNS